MHFCLIASGFILRTGEFAPLHVDRFILLPERSLYGISIEISEDRIGLINDITDVLRDKEASILTMYVQIGREGRGRVIIAMDLTDSKASISDLASEISNITGLGRVTIIEPIKEGFLVDTLSFPVYTGSYRMVFFRDVLLRGLIEGLKERIGVQAAEALLYHIGSEMGKAAAQDHIKMGKALGLKSPSEIVKYITIPTYAAIGFARAELSEFDEDVPRYKIRLYNSIECEISKSEGRPSSHLVRGMMAGALSGIHKTELLAEEKKCIATGDPYCELEIRPHQSL